ncbi:MAG: DUF2911 domain-containing protein [Planctomycetes bacterium]|nr:DUF2911 domain-containing protein [Planctomycetota bacterium]
MRNHLVAAMLAAATLLLSVLPAQQVGGGPDPDRRGSTLFVFADDGTISTGIAIGYSQAKWRAEYEGMLTTLRCKYARLGKNWWTTFDTVTALEIGGVRVEAGSYYLGIAVDDDGSFHLLLFASDKAMKAGLLPWTTALYRGEAKADLRVPMTLGKDALQAAAPELEIAITADPKSTSHGELTIRWGRHELSAPVDLRPAPSKVDAGDDK